MLIEFTGYSKQGVVLRIEMARDEFVVTKSDIVVLLNRCVLIDD